MDNAYERTWPVCSCRTQPDTAPRIEATPLTMPSTARSSTSTMPRVSRWPGRMNTASLKASA
ncbi:Uncharacterised protein [Mycobacteroides abscessus subsp. abscessus]|nr:Uncharacterised protein [Mycobacteroides abscessus subsp. abscessus]